MKRYQFNDANVANREWHVQDLNRSFQDRSNRGWHYARIFDNHSNAFIRNGNLIIRAFRRNGRYATAQLGSTTSYTPSDFEGKLGRKKLRRKCF